MKHTRFAWIAAIAFTAFAALPFCGRAQDDAAVFDKTTARLEKGGISFSYTQGAAAVQMVDKMIDSFEVLFPDADGAKEILKTIHGFTGELGLKTFLGSGLSVKKNGDYYRCIDFEYAPEHKGLIWDIIGKDLSKGPASELKLTSPKSAVAFSAKLEPGALYAYVDKKLRAMLDEDTMAAIDEQISGLAGAGIQPDKLLECISGITFYLEGREFKDEDFKKITEAEDPTPAILSVVPKCALILTTKSDLCWKALENFVSQNSPENVKDGKIVPVDGVAFFQDGNYLVFTNDEAAIRDRIAGKGSDLNANAEFAKMLALMPKDFSGFSWVSEDYFKTIASLSGVIGQVAGGVTGGTVPATDPSMILLKDLHSALATSKIDAEGLTFTTITSDLQVALLNSGTVAGVISGMLPYAGPIVKMISEMGSDDDVDYAERMEREMKADLALALLRDAKVPQSSCVFFTVPEDGDGPVVFAKWDEAAKEIVTEEETDECDFPLVFLTSPEAAEKADKPEETVVFYEDPNEFFDGIFVAFGDGTIKFLEGDFDNHAEAMEAAANTFGLSEKTAADLLKKAAAIDKIFEDED